MKAIVKNVEIQLNMNVSSIPLENVPEETIETAGEMFTYLGFCSKDFEGLSNFYIETFAKLSTKNIIVALNNKNRFIYTNDTSLYKEE